MGPGDRECVGVGALKADAGIGSSSTRRSAQRIGRYSDVEMTLHPQMQPAGPEPRIRQVHKEEGTTSDTALVRRIDRLEADPPIALSSVDLTATNPARLRQELGEVFFYFALVEGLVAQNAVEVETILPRLEEDDHRFLAVWKRHEVAHGAIFDALCVELDLPPAAPTPAVLARRSFRALGMLARQPWWHDVFRLIYLVRGAMHERLTFDAYDRVGARLETWGERALAATVTQPIRRQEAGHLGYYRAAAAAQSARLTSTQLRLARLISIRTYVPVGATGRRAQCGRAFRGIAGDDVEGLEPVQAIADQILGDGFRPLPRFVRAAMEDCLASR
jgi:hypothetical protein